MSRIAKKRGSKWDLKLTWKDQDGAVVDLTSAVGWFIITTVTGDQDDAIVIGTVGSPALAATTGATLTNADPSNGVQRMIVAETATDDLTPGSYTWAAQVKLSDGHVEERDGVFIIVGDRITDVA